MPTGSTRFRLAWNAFMPRWVLPAVLAPALTAMLALATCTSVVVAAPLAAMIPAAFVSLAVLALVLVPSVLVVGADGVLLAWGSRRRFLPHASIVDAAAQVRVEGYSNGQPVRMWCVELRLESGETVRLNVELDRPRAHRADDIVARIRAAKRSAARAEPAAPLAFLAHGGRAADAWIAELRAMGSAERADYRAAAPPTDALWAALEDPAARAEVRAAAAVALGPTLDDAGRARVRVAASGSAAPKLRVALDAVATAKDDAALAEALTALDADGATRGPTGRSA